MSNDHKRRHHHSRTPWYHVPHYHGQHSVHRADLVKGCVIAAVTLSLVAGSAFWINRWERQKYDTTQQALTHQTATEKAPPKSVEVNGIRYDLYTNLDAYLLIGVDVNGKVADMDPLDGGGQGDAQMVLVLNHDTKQWRILQLNRDSMVDVPVTGLTGKVIGHDIMQLALAHSYGTGREDSCRNNVTAVSQLLWDQFIQGYVALNMDGIAPINDALGGVEVTIRPEYGIPDPSMMPGSTVVLTGQQAVSFLRGRQGVGDETNLSRMGRHREYLNALTQQALTLDVSILLDAYDSAGEYLVSNLDTAALTDIAMKMKSYEQLDLITVKGTDTVQNDHAAYLLDPEDLQNVILQLFYHQHV